MNRSTVTRRSFLAGSMGVVLGVSGCGGGDTGQKRVGFMPKLTGIPYFNACEKGAREAAKELNLAIDYKGPSSVDANRQVEIANRWVSAAEADVICIACNDPTTPASALREARATGIPVITYDADSLTDARDFFVNQATYDSVAEMMVDVLAKDLDLTKPAKVGILTSSVTAPNQSEWAKRIRAYVKKKYPNMKILANDTQHGEDRTLGITKAGTLIESEKDLKGILGLTSVAVPAAAEAVRNKVKKGELKKGQIQVTGVSTPRDMKDYIDDDTVRAFVLWNPVDLGYLTVWVAHLKLQGKMPESGTIEAGRLKKIEVKDRVVLLGDPIEFTKDNIGRYSF